MNYWLHRISHCANISYPLLDKGFLTIGFSDFINTNIINDVLEENFQNVEKLFQEKWGNSRPRIRYNLYNFFNMKKGDIVIVPKSYCFDVCEIIDDKPSFIEEAYSDDLKDWTQNPILMKDGYLFLNDKQIDLGFSRRIKILHKEISRYKFADAKLTSRMKIRQTNADITGLKESIDGSIKNFIDNKSIDLNSIITEKTAPIVLFSIRENLNPDKLERLIEVYFKTIGADEVYIPPKNERKEGDVDVTATFENIKLVIYVQAKFHKGNTSDWAVNQVLDYVNYKEDEDDGYNKIAWVISSADKFNENAINKAKENNIRLINGLEFSEMLLNVGIKNI
jgi:hypothetical protein